VDVDLEMPSSEGWDANCGVCIQLPTELCSDSAGTGVNKDVEKFGTPQEKLIHGVCVVYARYALSLMRMQWL
jgi:hypothetical protein